MKSIGLRLSNRITATILYDWDCFVFGFFFERSFQYDDYIQLDIMLGFMSILITWRTR